MEKIVVGKITSSHGVKGNVKLQSYCEPNENIFKYQTIIDKKGKIYKIKKIGRLSSGLFITQIEGITTKNESDLLANTELYADRNEFKNVKDNEYYINDLIGMKVANINNENEIGKVVDVPNYGAGYLIEIEWNNNKVENFPFCKDYINNVDLENKVVYLNKPEYC